MKRYPFIGGPLDGLLVQTQETEAPEELECRITEPQFPCTLFALYALTNEDFYYHLGTATEPQEGVRKFADIAGIEVRVGKGKLRTTLVVWSLIEELTGGV